MENLYDDDELKDFLKRRVNQYKIYQSDKVWAGIYRALHTGRKWHILSGTLLLLTILTLIGLEKVVPDHKKNVAKNTTATLVTPAYYQTHVETQNMAMTPSSVSHPTSSRAHAKKELRSAVIADKGAPIDLSEGTAIQSNFTQPPPMNLLDAATVVDVKDSILQNNEQPTKLGNAINWLEEKIINKLLPQQKFKP